MACRAAIDVDDLERAQAFYLAAFDLGPGRRLGPDVVELLGGSSPLYLLRKTAGTVPSPGTAQRRDCQRHWSPMHLDFVVDDLDDAVQRVLAAGQPATEFTWGCLEPLCQVRVRGLPIEPGQPQFQAAQHGARGDVGRPEDVMEHVGRTSTHGLRQGRVSGRSAIRTREHPLFGCLCCTPGGSHDAAAAPADTC